MAKLNGVKTVDMQNGEITKIAYDGAEYAKVDDTTKKIGDLLYVTSTYPFSDTDRNAFYEVVYDAKDGGIAYIDEAGDECRVNGPGSNIFRKISADKPALDARVGALEERVTALEDAFKPQYKTEKRHAKVGERILIVRAESASGKYENGDVLTVVKDYGKSGSRDLVQAEGVSIGIFDGEYEVIIEETTVKPAPAQTITHKGAMYELVTRKAQPGDVVVIGEGGSSPFFSEGKTYVVTDRGASVSAIGNNGDFYKLYNFGRTESNTLVYAPKEKPLKVGDYVIINATITFHLWNYEVGEIAKVTRFRDDGYVYIQAEGKSEEHMHPSQVRKATDEEVAQATKSAKPKTDDIVVITANTNGSGNKVGDIGKVSGEKSYAGHPRVYVPGGPTIGIYTQYSDMRLATPAEVAKYEAAVADAEKPKLKVGDYAKVVVHINTNYFGGKPGDIVKIVKEAEDRYGTEDLNGGNFNGNPFVLKTGVVKATDAEVAEAQKAAFLTKIGRKPNEFKKGDIVRSKEPHTFGKVGEITDGPRGEIGGGNYTIKGIGVVLGHDIELIAPVESRVDAK